MSNIIECENGHFYDGNKYARCPYCNTLHKNKFFINERLESYMPIAEKWNFDSIIGQGRFSTVYKIISKDNLTENALKVISIEKKSEILSEEDDVTRTVALNNWAGISIDDRIENIEREIQYLYEMSSCEYFVHICNDYQLQWSEGIDYMIQMELLTPATVYFKENGFSEKELLILGMDICKALIYMEAKGLSHNDIKSSNVYRAEDGTYKLGDLGMTREISTLSSGSEFYVDLETSVERDVYSLGVMLYILAGGDTDGIQNCLKVDKGILPRPQNMGGEFFYIILNACIVSKDKRIKNASEMLMKLQQIISVSEEIVPFIEKYETDTNAYIGFDESPIDFLNVEASVRARVSEEFSEAQKSTESMKNSSEPEKSNIHKINYKAMYSVGSWTLFTCLMALMPLAIFFITRICFKPDFPYINKLITEMLYLALTLSITTIRDLAVLNLRKKEKFIFDFALCLSIIILIFTAMLFGAMTVKDMGLLQEQISNNMNTSALLGITLIMDICNIVIGICVQVAASDN